jgi:Zn-dependent protease with chaperone function
MRKIALHRKIFAFVTLLSLTALPLLTIAQTRVEMPKNKYKIQDDIKLGSDGAKEVEKVFPILNDAETTRYIERVGAKLVANIPQQFRQTAFNYRFKVINASDINAMALPGGPMYVNRGMIEAAKNEGEMAGVMAHEIVHVALRHSTANATKQGSLGNQLGMLGMIFGGAILGGEAGAQLGAMGAMAWMTKYSRSAETGADILGAQIMASAGYDPRDLANMFKTIEGERKGGGVPEWLSSHPDPGDRYTKINREADMLNVSSEPIKITRDFTRIQAKLRGMPKARTMAEIQKSAEATQNPTAGGRYTTNVALPSNRVQNYTGDRVSFSVPSNWKVFGSQDDAQFAPNGAYGDQGITRGAMIGVYQGQNRDLSRDSSELVQRLMQGNSYLSRRTNFTNGSLGNRRALAITLGGRSPVTNQNETVTVYSTSLQSGETFYLVTVVPDGEARSYSYAFNNILTSIRFSD